MNRLFLSSMFSDVSKLFGDYVGECRLGKRVTFIPTAARHEKINFYVNAGRKSLEKLGLIVDVLDVSTADRSEISARLSQNDIIYVSGGNTFFLLQELKKSGADLIIREQIQSGKIYIGESAGSVIMANNIEYVKEIDDIKAAPELSSYDALGITGFYPLPHYRNIPFKKSIEKIIQDYNATLPLVPFSNSQAILVNGDTYEVIKK